MKASFFTIVAFCCLLTSATTLYLADAGGPAGWRVVTMSDASLSTTLPINSLLFVRPIKLTELAPGMIVSFHHPYRHEQILTQKIQTLSQIDKQRYIQTVSENQRLSEGWSVPTTALVGRVVGHIPKVGGALSILQSVPGSLLFIVLPVLIIIGNELKVIFEIIFRKRLRLAIHA